MRTLFLHAFLLVLVTSLMSVKKDDRVSFESIYSNNDINKIVIRDKNNKFKEITDIESIDERNIYLSVFPSILTLCNIIF